MFQLMDNTADKQTNAVLDREEETHKNGHNLYNEAMQNKIH